MQLDSLEFETGQKEQKRQILAKDNWLITTAPTRDLLSVALISLQAKKDVVREPFSDPAAIYLKEAV